MSLSRAQLDYHVRQALMARRNYQFSRSRIKRLIADRHPSAELDDARVDAILDRMVKDPSPCGTLRQLDELIGQP